MIKTKTARPVVVPPPGPVPLYPTAWGWNSGGRSGNITDEQIDIPKRLQRSTLSEESFIGCAAGQHHTLLVSDEGRVYALGEGRRGQLGLGNEFTGPLKKGGVYQATPKMVTPSGVTKYKHDMKISQVACGGTFSVAKELSIEEGIDIVTGYRELEKAITLLRERYGESSSVLHAWSLVRQERFRISRRAEGQVLVWGTGEHGELGLGVLGKVSLYPQLVWKFRDMCITHVSAGARHVLAIDSRGRLYSWGSGRSGRLGHGDFLDRDRPELVTFFNTLFCESCSAGDAHSAVLTTMRAGSRDTQLKRISTFGRGAHGRLGNGTNRNMSSPVLVSQWLPSLQKVQFHQVACGGAHTLALASLAVPQGIANPRGMETFVAAWGYGMNGQLGTGYR
jgi:alpha-tubulin suppressor-like RCC1 family protein